MQITVDKTTWGKFSQYSEMASVGIATLIVQRVNDLDPRIFISYCAAAYLAGKAISLVNKAVKEKGLLSENMQRTLEWSSPFAGGILCGRFFVDPTVGLCSWGEHDFFDIQNLAKTTSLSAQVALLGFVLHTGTMNAVKNVIVVKKG